MFNANAAVFATTSTITLTKEVSAAVFVTTSTMTLAKEVSAAVFVTTPTMTLAKRSLLLCLSQPTQWHMLGLDATQSANDQTMK